MRIEPLALGIDIGSSRIKVALISPLGHQVAIRAVPTPFVARGPESEMTVAALLDAVARAIGRFDRLLPRVDAVGIASMGECGTTIVGEELADLPLIAWFDTRGVDTAREVRARIAEVDALIGRKLRPATAVAKLGWLRGTGRPVAGAWLSVAAIVAWRLTGVAAVEPSVACTTGAFNPRTRRWLPDVATAAGLPALCLPDIRQAGELVGRIAPEGGRWSGLPAGVPVTFAGHDHLVGAVGAGGGTHDIVDSMGTGEPLLRSIAEIDAIPAARLSELTLSCWPGSGQSALLSERYRPGRIFENLARITRDRMNERPDMRDLGETPDDCELIRMLDALQERRALDVPYGSPEQLREWVLAALARATASQTTSLAGLDGVPRRTLIIGGGARDKEWLAAKCLVAPLPTFVVKEPEAVARGAAIFAGVVAGWWNGAEAAPPPSATPIEELFPLSAENRGGPDVTDLRKHPDQARDITP